MAKRQLPVALTVPVDFEDPLRNLRDCDVRVARLEGMQQAVKKYLQREKDRRSVLYEELAAPVKRWLRESHAPKTLATPDATFKRRERSEPKMPGPTTNDDKEALVEFLLDNYPDFVTEETVYDYSWSEVEPVVIDHVRKNGELPWPTARIIEPGETLNIETLSKEQARGLSEDVTTAIHVEEERSAESIEKEGGPEASKESARHHQKRPLAQDGRATQTKNVKPRRIEKRRATKKKTRKKTKQTKAGSRRGNASWGSKAPWPKLKGKRGQRQFPEELPF